MVGMMMCHSDPLQGRICFLSLREHLQPSDCLETSSKVVTSSTDMKERAYKGPTILVHQEILLTTNVTPNAHRQSIKAGLGSVLLIHNLSQPCPLNLHSSFCFPQMLFTRMLPWKQSCISIFSLENPS